MRIGVNEEVTIFGESTDMSIAEMAEATGIGEDRLRTYALLPDSEVDMSEAEMNAIKSLFIESGNGASGVKKTSRGYVVTDSDGNYISGFPDSMGALNLFGNPVGMDEIDVPIFFNGPRKYRTDPFAHKDGVLFIE